VEARVEVEVRSLELLAQPEQLFQPEQLQRPLPRPLQRPLQRPLDLLLLLLPTPARSGVANRRRCRSPIPPCRRPGR
jgi:hypothetical protein